MPLLAEQIGEAFFQGGEIMYDKTIIVIVISGTNIMSQSLCYMEGIICQKGKKAREVSYHGPVTSASDVTKAVSDLFIGV